MTQRSTGIRAIEFARTKYGTPLLVDVAEVSALRGFIQTPEPHALRFYELMFVTEGGGALAIDGGRHQLAAGVTLVTRPGEVRRWELRSALRGVALFFEPEFVDDFFAGPPFVGVLDAVRADARIPLPGAPFARCLATLAWMIEEVKDLRGDSEHFLHAGLYQLLATLNRHSPSSSVAGEASSGALVRAFRTLVDERFREMSRVADYARLLGVTPEHLSRCVSARTGLGPSDLIQRRLLLEAQRRLLYADEPIGMIADDLGFNDHSYFNRFFKRRVSLTPRRCRQAGKR